MTALRRLTVALVAAVAAAIVYVAGRIAVPLVIALLSSRFGTAGGGAAAAYVTEPEVLAVAALAFGAVLLWQVRSRKKG
jgi:hypothetical protein